MSNSLKGIIAKISNLIHKPKNSTKEDLPLTYAEYRSQVELSEISFTVSPNNKRPGATGMIINSTSGNKPIRPVAAATY